MGLGRGRPLEDATLVTGVQEQAYSCTWDASSMRVWCASQMFPRRNALP